MFQGLEGFLERIKVDISLCDYYGNWYIIGTWRGGKDETRCVSSWASTIGNGIEYMKWVEAYVHTVMYVHGLFDFLTLTNKIGTKYGSVKKQNIICCSFDDVIILMLIVQPKMVAKAKCNQKWL